jgi:anti-sigma regulatory factor (Ser/Thr protein kinase)
VTAGASASAAADGDTGGGDAVGTGARGDRATRSTIWEVPRSAAAVGRARHELRRLLERRGVRPDACDSVLLVAHELVVNGVEHGRAPVRLAVGWGARAVRIDVHDGSSAPPRLEPLDPTGARGRGLQIVEGLATRWGWRLDGDGKTVWAEVPITDRHPGPTA